MVLGLFGFAVMGTSVFNLTPVVLRELLGAEHVTSSMGVQSAVQGIAFIASSYITGKNSLLPFKVSGYPLCLYFPWILRAIIIDNLCDISCEMRNKTQFSLFLILI